MSSKGPVGQLVKLRGGLLTAARPVDNRPAGWQPAPQIDRPALFPKTVKHPSKPGASQQNVLSYTKSVQQAKRRLRAWTPIARSVVLKPSASALADVSPLLARVVEALGTNAAARLLDADRAQVLRWTSGKEAIGSEMGRRIVDLHDVLTRILRVYNREAAAMWLVGSEPLLGGARPIDVLAMEGAGPVVRAIDGIAEGASA